MQKIANAFIRTDPGGAITYWSQEAEQLLGWDDGTVSGRDFFTLIAAAPLKLSQLLSEGTHTFELSGRHQDGHELELELNLCAEQPHNAGATGVILFIRDVSAERRQALRLSQSEERNRQIFENALDAVVVANKQGIVVAWNRHAETTFGWTVQEAVGRNLTEVVIPPRFHAQHREGMNRFLQTGEKRIIDKRLEIVAQHRQGHEFPVELTISTATVGEELLFTAFLRDISERQKMLERVKQSEERNRQIVENALDAVVTADDRGMIDTWNQQAVETFGWTKQEAVGRNLMDTIIPPQFHAQHEQGMRRYLMTSEKHVIDQRVELVARHRDGHEFPVELTISTAKVDSKQIFTAFLRDITDRKLAEERLKTQIASLQQELKDAQLYTLIAEETGTAYFGTAEGGALKRSWAKLLAVSSFHGGTGKSYLTIQLAALLAAGGQRIGILDLDIEAPSMHSLFGLNGSQFPFTFNDYIAGHCELKQIVYNVTGSLKKAIPGEVWLIPSSIKPGQIAQLLSQGYDAEDLQTLFSRLTTDFGFDYVFIDTHAGLNEEVLMAMDAVSHMLIVLRPDAKDYEGSAVLLQVARKLRCPNVSLVLNQVRDADTGALIEQVTAMFDTPIAALIPEAADAAAFDGNGAFVLEQPEHPASLAVRSLIAPLLQSAGRQEG